MQQDDSGRRLKNVKLIVAVLLLIAAGILTYMQFGTPDAAETASTRNFIDISNNKPFSYTLQIGDIEPIKAPSGGLTGYAAESCYWGKDADGKWFIKDEPILVVLKTRLDPTSTEETFCPDCNRRVVGHNKKPIQADIDRANGQGSEAPDENEETESRE